MQRFTHLCEETTGGLYASVVSKVICNDVYSIEVQCIAFQFSAVQCQSAQYSVSQWSAVQYSSVQCSVSTTVFLMKCSTVMCVVISCTSVVWRTAQVCNNPSWDWSKINCNRLSFTTLIFSALCSISLHYVSLNNTLHCPLHFTPPDFLKDNYFAQSK